MTLCIRLSCYRTRHPRARSPPPPACEQRSGYARAGAQADTQVSTTTDFAYPSDSGNMQGRFKTRVFAAKGWLLRVHLQDLAASTSRVKIQREIVDCRCVWCVACNSVTQTTHFLHQSTSSRGRWLVLPHRCASCQTCMRMTALSAATNSETHHPCSQAGGRCP